MEIEISHLTEGAQNASGIAVVIDVFRAFSTACYVFNGGAEKIVPVGTVDRAFELKMQHPDWMIMGEREERKVEGFDFGNSPSHLIDFDFTGRSVIQTTSAGTRGLVNAGGADEVLTGSFVNAAAIAQYIRKKSPEKVSLVCMGYAAEYQTEEDTFCAEYIKALLLNEGVDFRKMREVIRNTAGKRFFIDENQYFAPSADFDLCLDLNKFPFVLKLEEAHEGFQYLKKLKI